MYRTCTILVGALLGSCMLGACGQPGPLFIPQDPAAAQRATLPDILLRRTPQADAPSPAKPPSKSPEATSGQTSAPTSAPSTPTSP
ncbi:MAG: hypothetical protein EBR27_07865 [Betaproteobacteria bacterium]|nr:hypothetical protein [Betaproteobacteria bacterium]